MKHLVQRITTIAASVALAGGALVAAGGSASAAESGARVGQGATVAVSTADVRYSPWIADQLALFEHGNRIDPDGLGSHRNHFADPRHDRGERRDPGGVLLAAGGSVSVAAFGDSARPGAVVAISTADVRYSPWIADQLALSEHGNRIDPGGLGSHRNHFADPRHDRGERREL
ncbi:hypothetical protein ABZ468_43675 [Streptomyces sp. NPDC005708]|uniref:hypothetical protein n=1 Tax=Streptomyces sp. NPDC005708 TaxID=3154564 RepID=UPI0033C5F2C7